MESSENQTLPKESKPSQESEKLPEINKKNIELTAKQMFPGCALYWSKTYVSKPRLVVVLENKSDQKDMVPLIIEGELPHIAKTLIVLFASVQHVVVRNMAKDIEDNYNKQRDARDGNVQEN